MKNTKLGSVQIYYSAYNKAAVLEKKLTIVLKSDATDHRHDFISHSQQSDGNCFQVALHYVYRYMKEKTSKQAKESRNNSLFTPTIL